MSKRQEGKYKLSWKRWKVKYKLKQAFTFIYEGGSDFLRSKKVCH